jgi:peptide/nickel transport system substrate-binding protein
VLAKHAVDPDTFEETSMTPLLGSGPYRVGPVDPGKSITLTRDPDYWGRDLAVNRGFWNFDEVRVDYYRDASSYHEAFKKGLFDVRKEDDPGRWTSSYDFPAVREGHVVKETFTSGLPKPSINFVFNMRRPVFADIRVREALGLLFDFEWVNRSIFFGLYRRGASFFEDSELSANGRTADARERALLAPYPDAVRPDVMDGTWRPPVTDGSGRDRTLLRRALELLGAAGYELRGTEVVERASGKPLNFEILTLNRDEERLALLYAAQLKRAGITAQVRLVDAVQYEARRIAFDFDMIEARWDESLSPGNEQAFYWSAAAADSNGSRNYMGLKSPAADALIAALPKAETREEVVAAVRALDRVLMSGSFVVPLFYAPEQWIVSRTYPCMEVASGRPIVVQRAIHCSGA